MEMNIHTMGGTFIAIHDELKGDYEAKASIHRPIHQPNHQHPYVKEADLAWFSDITEGEMFTLVFADTRAFTFVARDVYISSGSSDPRHTCDGDGTGEYCPGCDRVR